MPNITAITFEYDDGSTKRMVLSAEVGLQETDTPAQIVEETPPVEVAPLQDQQA